MAQYAQSHKVRGSKTVVMHQPSFLKLTELWVNTQTGGAYLAAVWFLSSCFYLLPTVNLLHESALL